VVLALVIAAVLVAGAGITVVTTQRTFLLDQVDQRLARSAPPAAGFFVRRNANGDVETGTTGTPGSAPLPAPRVEERTRLPNDLVDVYVAEVGTNGSTLHVFVPGRKGLGTPEVGVTQLSRLARTGQVVTVPARGAGGSFRVRVRAADTGYVVVGLSLAETTATVDRLTLVVGATAAVVLGLLALLGWWVVRLGVRPILRMTETADAITQGETDRRVDEGSTRTEAGRLGHAFNAMLDERQAAEDRLRRFVADASHELRTPLTSIRGYLDLYRRGALDERPALDDALRRVDQEAHRMSDMVEDLLLLARLDEGRELVHEDVDLERLLHDAVSDASAVQPERPIDLAVDASLVARGDEARLRQVVGAIVHNALVHTDRTARVRVCGHRVDDACVIEVHDDGPGMPQELVDRAFDRFVRGNAGRSRHAGSTGLGLAIADSVTQAHGGTISLRSRPGEGTSVRVVLPADVR
jgi:two-component system OmpR family sensor kinase